MASVAPAPKFTGLDNDGNPLVGGLLTTFLAGTTTPQATYSDVGLTTPNANPIVLDAGGRATVFLTPGISYKFLLQTGAAVTIWSQDNILAVPSSNDVDVLVNSVNSPTIAAGKVVYLSDGSGGAGAGGWTLADSANDYSSALPIIGITLIALGALPPYGAAVRIAGRVTGLAGLVTGTTYYVGTAGALTSTRPALNARVVGVADSASTLILAQSPSVATLGIRVLARSTTEQAVTNTVVNTSVFSTNIPANTLGTNKTLRLVLTGYYTNTSGGASNLTPTVTWGGTTIASVALAYATGTQGAMYLEAIINANGATGSQRSNVRVNVIPSAVNVAAAALTTENVLAAYHDTLAIDSTIAQTLGVNVQHSVANAAISFKRWLAIVEVLD